MCCYVTRPGWAVRAGPELSEESSLALVLLDDLVGDSLRDLRVALELHRVHRAARGLRPQVTDVTEHLRERDVRTHDLHTGGVLHGLDLAAARVQVADDVAHVLLRSTDLDAHQRFEQDGLRLASSLLEAHGARDLERHLRGVDVVRGTVEDRRLDADHRVPGEDAVLHGIAETGIDRGDVLARDAATRDLVLELVDLVALDLERLDRELDLRELAGPTGLLLVRVVVLLDRALDGLAVRDLGLAHVGLDVELALHAVDQDVEVELAHALDDRLTGLLVLLRTEGRVLFGELLDRRAELLLVGLGLRLDGDLDDGLGEGHRLEDDLVLRIAERVARGGVLEADDRVDVTGGDRGDRVLLVGVHLEDLPDALLLGLRRVEDLRAGIQVTG